MFLFIETLCRNTNNHLLQIIIDYNIFVFFFIQDCDPCWHVVNSSLLQCTTQVLAHVVCMGFILSFNWIYCFQVHTKTSSTKYPEVSKEKC